LNILGIIGNKRVAGAVEIYRITMPFMHINNNSGESCAWMTLRRAAALLQTHDTGQVFDNDIVVLHRTLAVDPDAGETLINALRVHGAKVVYEADDDYSGNFREADSVAGRTWKPYIAHADAVTVTTKSLATLAKQASGKPVYVLPNAIEYDKFTAAAMQAKREVEGLTIMLVGTKTHYHDWEVLKAVLPKLLADYPEVTLLVGGYLPDYLEATGLGFLPPVHYSQYPEMLAQADILCAPLDPDDQFNRSKSPIKAVEGWCAARAVGKRLGGCAVIASNCVSYRGTVQNRNNGLLVKHTPEAWDKALRRLIEDRHLRQTLQVKGLKDAKRHDMATLWKNWHQAYRNIATTGGAL
jgi:glycosyltransferase involved in cell wall biosynthesis